eukprot:1195456-Prorocentrum_minimum.AAC.1
MVMIIFGFPLLLLIERLSEYKAENKLLGQLAQDLRVRVTSNIKFEAIFKMYKAYAENTTKDKALLEAAKRIASLEEEVRHAKKVTESANRAADECRNTLREKGKKFASLQRAKQEAEAVALDLNVS